MDEIDHSPVSKASKHSVDEGSSGSIRESYDACNLERLDASPKENSVGFSDSQISEAERKLVRKLDKRIMPIICLVYLFAFLDRSNLGNARLQGLSEDTLHGDPTGKLFDWVNSAFFFSYILVQLPGTVTSKLFPPRLWMGVAAIGWGLCSTLLATAFNFPGLMVGRIGLGAFEACFAPQIPCYLSLFYTKREIGLRLAVYFSFATISGAFGGLIAFGVQQANTAISNWRLLFIVEGVPAVIMGIVAITLLPDRPEMTSFFNEEERKLALERINRATSADVGFTINKAHIFAALRDWRVYGGGIIYFAQNCANASITAFLPTIIKTFGFTNAIAQLLTVPPYIVSSVVMTLTSYMSDRRQMRGMYMTVASIVGGIGYLLLILVKDNIHVRYFATFCVTSGLYTTIGLIIAWYAHNLGSETKRAAGLPIYMAIGQCGSILGSHIFPITEGPLYIQGFAISCALEFASAITSFVLSVSYSIANRRRDRMYGVPDATARVDVSELADKAPAFRYVP